MVLSFSPLVWFIQNEWVNELDTCSTSGGCAVFTWSVYSTVWCSHSLQFVVFLASGSFLFMCQWEIRFVLHWCLAVPQPKLGIALKRTGNLLGKSDGRFSWSLQADMWRTISLSMVPHHHQWEALWDKGSLTKLTVNTEWDTLDECWGWCPSTRISGPFQ